MLEAGDSAGHAVRQWSHVRMFSPWTYNIDRASERLLRGAGWNSPDPDRVSNRRRTAREVSGASGNAHRSREHIRTDARVISIARAGFDKVKSAGREAAPFEIRYQNGKGPSMVRADAVIDASGTWNAPNPAGVNGLDAIGEAAHADRIAYGMPDVFGAARARYANKVVAVLGAGHSAVGTILDLARLKQAESETPRSSGCCAATTPEKYAFGGGANDKLAARGELGRCLPASCKVAAFALRPGSASRTSAGEGAAPARRRLRLLRPPRAGRRADCRHRLPSRSFVLARVAHRSRPRARMPAGPGSADRPQSAQLRRGPPAWRA